MITIGGSTASERTNIGKILIIVATALWFVTPSLADISIPTTITMLFQKDGKPHRKPVDFKIRCYGYATRPGKPGFPHLIKPDPYTPQEVYSFSGTCSGYGCSIHHSLYLNYRHIDYCDMEGQTEGESFKVEKFGKHPAGECSGGENCVLKIALPR
jgi:hypothetical protein